MINNHWLYSPLPEDQPQFECLECGKPQHKENTYCSSNCWEASML